ncbi:MAG: hypothetical protein WA306_09405 [Candidatus Acidiferrales bacterium]
MSASGFDLVTRWKDSQSREQICRDWNSDDSDEQFYVSGVDNSEIHVVVHGALAADADAILDGLTSTPGFTHELLKDGFISIECGGRTVNLRRRAPKSNSTHRERRAGSSYTGNQEV